MMATKRSSRAVSVSASSMKACKSRKLMSKKMQREIEEEESAETIPMSAFFKEAVYGIDTNVDEIDEQSEEFENRLDYQDLTSEKEEEEEDKLLEALLYKDGSSIANRLSNAITCIKDRDQDKDYNTASVAEATCMSKSTAIDYFQSLGKFMSAHTQGKLPKALYYLINKSENWVGLLKLTQPESWSPSAMYKATIGFASTTKAGLFYQLFLLPRVRQDIKNHRKLHFYLYQSLVKALFKPKEFYVRIVIPLCKSGSCTIREAVIISSIMKKNSIPENFSSTALACLANLDFFGTTSYFIKVILEKKYALAYLAIDAVTAHFLRFHKDTTVMPVIWHQTLLAFVQRYKHELSKEDKMSLRSLVDKQHHKLITPEIARELDCSRNRGDKLNLPSTPMPIKEDLSDMPQVPMEEDY